MDRSPPKSGADKGKGRDARPRDGEGREARLKAALKANLARRKAQARARAAEGEETGTENGQD